MRSTRLKFVLLALALWIAGSAGVYAAADAAAPAVSAADALNRLMRGNARFQRDENGHPVLHSEGREDLVGSQAPFAVILSCSDSRVPPELIFDEGLGSLFVVRIAGNTVTRAGLESIDYAVGHLGTNLIMVLGHDSCGAVKGAIGECSSKTDDALPEIFANICPSVREARTKDRSNLESSAIDLNVAKQVKVLKSSPQLQKRVAEGSLKIVGARYNLKTGKVELLGGD